MAARFDSEDGGPGGAASTAALSFDLRGASADNSLALPTGPDAALPDRFLLDAQYARDGLDLVMSLPGVPAGDASVRLIGYFDGAPATLADAAGRALDGSVVAVLAGPRAPAQLAQADGAAADAALGPAIGTLTETTGTVSILRADGRTVEAEAGLPVYQDDQVESAPGGAVGMRFTDGSTFSLGSDARVVLDALIYDPGADSSMTLNLVKGSFSFVSGQIAKSGDENMQINTPVATIGVRGTAGAGDENEVVLLPEEGPDGEPVLGEISFRTQGGETILNQPNQGSFANSPFDPPSAPRTVSDTDVTNQFGDALGFLPSDIPANRVLRQNRQGDEDDGDGADGDGGEAGGAPEGEEDPDAPAEGADGEGDGGEGEGDGEEDPDAEAEEAETEEEEEAEAGEGEEDPEGLGATGEEQIQLAAGPSDGEEGDGAEGETPGDQPQDGQPDPDAQEADDADDPEDLVEDIDFGEEGAEGAEGVDQGGAGATTAETSTSVSGAGGGVSGNVGGGVSGEGGNSSSGDGSTGTVGGGATGDGGDGGGSGGGGAGDADDSGATLLGDADDDEDLLDEDRDEAALDGDGGGDGDGGTDAIIVTGSGGSDTLSGAGGNDSLDGGGGDDQLFGGAGADNLTGGAGNDLVSGGSGGDTIVGGSGEGDDIYVGGDMTTAGGTVTALDADDSADDTVIYTSATQGVTVNLADGSAVFGLAGATTAALTDLLAGSLSLTQFGGAYGPQTGTDALYGVEHIESGVGDDHLTGDSAANSITAGDGDDYINGAAGFSRSTGSPGADVIDAGAGDDVVLYDTAYAEISGASFDGGTGADTLRIAANQAADLSDIAAQASNFEIIELQDSDSSLDIDSASVQSLVGVGGTLTVTGSDGLAVFDAQSWTASESGSDAQGQAYSLLTDGATTVRVADGVSTPGINLPPSYASVHGNALRFDSSLDQAQGPDSLAQTDDVTLEAWIEWDGTYTESDQVAVYNGEAGSGNGFGIALIDTGAGYSFGGLVDGATTLLSNAAVAAETPTHVALVREDGVFTLYVDGQAEPVTNPTVAPTTPGAAFAIGGIPLTSALGFTGAIDDVRVWSAARSQAQIEAARSVHLSGTEDGLFAWYPVTADGYLGDQTDGSTLSVTGADFETSGVTVTSFAAQEDGSFVLSLGVLTDPDGSNEEDECNEGEELQEPDSSGLTLTVSDGVLSVNTAISGGVGLLDASGGGTSTLTLSATLEEINTTLRSGGISFTPSEDMSGQSQLTLSYTDSDATNPQTTSETLTIDVAAVADAPLFGLASSFTSNPGVPIALGLTAASNDVDLSEALQLTISGVPSGGAFDAGSDLGGGTFVVEEADFASLAYIPPVDSLDTATLSFTLSVTDGDDVLTTVTPTTISLSLIDIAFDNDFETGDLLTAENWAGDLQPGPAYNAQIADEENVTLTTGQSLTLGAMDLGAGTLSIDGGRLQINGQLTTEGNGIGTFGAVDLSGGTLALGGGTLAGDFVWTGGELTGAGTLATASTVTIDDAGADAAGALDLNGVATLDSVLAVDSAAGNFLRDDARLLGGGALRVGGTLDVGDDVTLSPSFDIQAGGRAILAAGSGGSELELLGGGSNAGVLVFSGASTNPGSQVTTMVVADGESFTNLSGGVVQTSNSSTNDVYAFRGAFVNQGTWDANGRTRFETGSGVSLASLDNSEGTIDVASGDSLSFADGAILRLGTLSALTGDGAIGFDGGRATVALDDDFTWTSSTLKFDLSSASVTVSGPGDFINDGALTLVAADGDVFDARLVNNENASVLFDNSASSDQEVAFNGGIDTSGLITLGGGSTNPGSQAATLAIGDGETLTIREEGTLRTTANSTDDVSKIRGDIDNLGTIDIDGRTAIEAVGVSSAALDTENGSIDVASGRTLSIEDGAVLRVGMGSTLSGAGVIALQGPGTVMELVSDFTWTATTLGLDVDGTNASTGQVTIGGTGDFYNEGTLTIAQNDDVFAVDVVNTDGATLAFVNSSDTGPDVRFTEGLQNDGVLILGGASTNPNSQAATLTVDAGVTLVNGANGTVEFSNASTADLHTIRGDFQNLGTVEVMGAGQFQTGSASATVLDSTAGRISIFSGRRLTMEDGVTLSLGSSSVIDGAGVLSFDGAGAVLDVASDFTWTSSDTGLDLTQTSVTVAGEGSFTNSGRLTLQPDSDVFDIGLVNASGATLVLTNSTVTNPDLVLNQGLVNQGVLSLAGGSTNPGSQAVTLSVAEGQTLTNETNATIETGNISTDDSHTIEGDLLNLGTLQIGGLTEIEAGATSQGVLDTENGTVTVLSGRTLEIGSDAVLRVGTGSTLDGSGTILFSSSSASLDVASDFIWSASTLGLDVTQAKVTIGGTGTFSVGGDLTMAADDDVFATELAVLDGGTLAFNNSADTNPTIGLLEGGTNDGLIVLAGGSTNPNSQATSFVIADGHSFTNLSNGIFRAGHADASQDIASVEGTFVNQGTLDVQSTLEFDDPGTVLDTRDGTVTVGSGDLLRIDDGALMQIGADTVLNGQGTIQFDEASKTLEVVEDFTWTASELTLDLTQTDVTITGPDTTFTNAGTLTLAVGGDALGLDFVNAGGGSLALTNSGASSASVLNVADSFTNQGVMTLTGGSTNPGSQAVTIDVASGVTFTNEAGGTLTVDHPNASGDTAELRGTYSNAGLVEIDSRTIIEDHFTNAGTLRIAAGQTLEVSSGALVNTGTLEGQGTLRFTNGATFDNQGTIDVAGASVGGLTIEGADLDLSDETLSLDIANTSSFDTLDVDGLDLTGAETLSLTFQNPSAPLGTYRIVTYDGHDTQAAGVFETVASNLDSALYDAALVYQADGIDLLVRAKPQLAGAADLTAREDEGVSISGLSVSDADGGASDVLTVDLSVDAGTLGLSDTAASGVTIVTDDADAVQLTGTIAQLNSFLAGANAVRFNPAADASGAVTLTLALTDGDGVQSTKTQTITVSPVDDGASATLSYLGFDGTDDYLDAGDGAALDMTGGMTLEVRATMATAPGAGDLATLASKWGAWGEKSYWFGVDGDTGQLKLVLSPDGGSTERTFLSGESVATGQWAQYSVSVDPDADAVRFYIDGEPVGAPQSFTDAGPYSGASRFLIGANQGSGAAPVHHFDGGIAEVRLWSAARDDADIAQKHDQLLQGTEGDLAGYWLLDGLADGAVADRSANSNQALALHGPTPDPGAAYLSFDGADDVIDLPAGANGIRTGLGAFTWEGWVRIDPSTDLSDEPTLVMIGDAATGQRGNLYVDSGGALSFVSYNQSAETATSAQGVATGEWTHVAVAYDGTQVQLYVDGAASGAAQTVGLNINGGGAAIGAAVDDAKHFEGDLADIRIWSEAKSAADLAAFKDGRLTGDEANLEGWWPLDEGIDATVFDRSGAGYHGTLDGPSWENATGGPPFAPGAATLALTAADQRVDLGGDDALFQGETSFTLETWVKVDTADIPAARAQVFAIGSAANAKRTNVVIDAGDGKVYASGWNNTADQVASSAAIQDDAWNHIAVAYDSDTRVLEIFLNGESVGSQVQDQYVQDILEGTAYLGGADGFGNDMIGEFAEARVWAVKRSAAEIAESRLDRLSGAEEGLVGYWPLNDGSGTSAANLAPGGSAATLEGGAGWTSPSVTAPASADSGGPLFGAATADASESEEAGTFYLLEDQTLSGVMAAADVEGTPSYAISGETSTDGTFSIRETGTGVARINVTTGEWTYTPGADETGSDAFTITVAGADSGTDSQEITIQLDAAADAPQLGATHGKALDMGAGEDIVVPNDPALEPGAGSFTVEAWVDLSTVAADGDQYEYIVTKGNVTSGEEGWSIFSINNQLFVRVNGNDGFSQRASQRIPDVSDLEGWHHVALVVDRDANEIRGYLNGSNDRWVDGGAGPSSNSIAGFDPIDSSTDMLIGGVRNGANATEASFSHVGRVDEVRVWSTARTADELSTYSQLRLDGAEDDLAAAYSFEDANDLGRDVTDNGHDGALSGSPDQVDSGAEAGGFDTDEDAGSVALTGITVADPDTGGEITVVMEVERGTLTIDPAVSGGIGAGGIVGNGAGKLILSGTASAIATTLAAANGLLYAAAADASGLDRLQVTANDGQGISTRSYDITIDAVDDAIEAAGGALQFDGTDDFAEAAQLSAFDGATSLTLEGWINTSQTNGAILQLTGSDTLELSVDGSGQLALSAAAGDGGSAVGTTAVNTGEWVHVAAVLEGGQAQLYVNGAAAGSGAVSAALSDPNLLIGKTQADNDHFQGALDEIRLWTTARSAAEIEGAYQRQLTGDEAGLAAYYRFDERLIEELTDSSGNGAAARLGGVDRSAENDASPNRLNDLNGALRFDGTGVVDVGHDPALSPASFTIETWVRADSADRSAEQRLLISPDSVNEATAFALNLDDGAPSVTVSGGASGAEVVTVDHGASVDDGLWRHVAGVYDGASGALSLYVDGRLSGTAELSGALLSATDDLRLGANGFVGDLAETRLWSVARSPQEIQDSFELAARGDESGLVSLWRGVEDPDGGTTVLDLAGGHDGTVSGGVSFTDPMAPIEGPAGGTLEVEALEGRTVTGVASAEDVGGPVSFAITSVGAITNDGDWQQQSLSAGVLRLHTVTGEWVFEAAYDVTGPQSFEITAVGDDGRSDAQTVSVSVRDFDFDPQVQGGALSFDGSSLIDVGRGVGDSLAVTGDLTVEMWVNPTSLDGGRLLSFHGGPDDGAAQNALYTLSVTPGGEIAFTSETGEGTNHDAVFEDATLASGAWRHVSVVRDTAAEELRLYIDGQLADAVDYAITPTGGEAARLIIGANSGDGGNYFNGFMDEIRVWSEARSASQIDAAWDRQIANPTGESALEAYWRGDDRDGQQLTDASANGNHAALGGVGLTDLSARTLQFDGQNDYLARDSVVLGATDPYTVQARFKWDGSDSLGDMVLAYNGTYDQGGQTGGSGFGLGLERTGTASFQIAGLGGDGTTVTGPGVVAGRWYDVALTHDGSTLRLYVDGVAQGSLNAPSESAPAGEFRVGAALTPMGEAGYFAGEIDSVAVWSDVRTADEVAADAGGAISPAAAGLAAYYRAEAATDQTVTDLTGGPALGVDGARVENDPGPQIEGNRVEVPTDRIAAGTFKTYEIEGDGSFAIAGGTTVNGLNSLTEAGKGTLRIDPDTGGWLFEPATGFAGEVSFTVTATGSLSGADSETLTFRVLPPAEDQTPPTVAGARLAFDGADVAVAAADPVLARTDDLTIELTVKPAALPGEGATRTLVSHTGDGSGDGANTLYSLSLDENGDIVYSHQTTGGGLVSHSFTGADLTAGDWTQLSLVRDVSETSVELYKDGVSVGAYDYAVLGAPIDGSDGRLLLGAADGAGADGFVGEMDEIRLYGAARTADEITFYADRQAPAGDGDLLVYYRGETTAAGLLDDVSGQGRDAVLGAPAGADSLAPRSIEPPTRALRFDGTNDYLSVANDAALDPASFTVEAWFRTDAAASRLRILSRSDDDSAFQRYGLRLENGEPTFSVANDDGGITGHALTAGGAVNDGLWRHMAGAYDAATGRLSLYLDGELAAEKFVDGPLLTTASPLFIGAYDERSASADQRWDGDIADVRLWSEARDVADIRAAMNERLSGDESGLAAWWALDDGAAGDAPASLADGAGSNDASAAGAPEIVDAAPEIGGGVVGTAENQSASGVWDASAMVEGAVAYGIEGGTVADGVSTLTTAHGTASVDVSTGAWAFVPTAGYAGGDGFTLTATGAASGAVRQAMTVEIEETPAAVAGGGDALSFGGGADAVTASGISGLSSSALTVELWLNPAETGNSEAYVLSYANGVENDAMGVVLDDTVGPRFFLNKDIAPDAGELFDAGVGPLTPGEWAHLAVTWDQASGETAFYVNGVKTAEGIYKQGSSLANGGTLVLGQDQDSIGGGFDPAQAYSGLMDEVRVWSVVRSAEEIADAYDAQVDAASSDLAVYYRADGYNGGDLSDASANGADAGLAGVTVLAPPTSAAAFDRASADSHIAIDVGGAASALDLTDRLSVEAWIRPADLSADQAIFSKFDGANGFEFGVDDSGRLTFSGGAGLSGETATSDGTLSAGAWAHVSVVFEGGAVRFTIDGESAGETILPNSLLQGEPLEQLSVNTDDALIGAREDSGVVREFDGAIGELRVWSDARSADEIFAHRDSPIADPAAEAELAGYWRLDDVAGGAPRDLAGALDGRVLGAVTASDGAAPLSGTTITLVEGEGYAGRFEAEVGGAATYSLAGGTVDGDYSALSLTEGVARIHQQTGAFSFTPAAGYTGTASDLFTLQAVGRSGATQSAQITAVVEAAPTLTLNAAGASLRFDGDDDVTVAGAAANDIAGGEDFTIEAWIYNEGSGAQTLIEKLDPGASSGGFTLETTASNNLRFVINGNGSNALNLGSSGRLPDNEWTHVAVSVDSDSLVTVYKNGAEIASSPFFTGHDAIAFEGGDLVFGDGFDGLMDDVRLWTKARSAEEIQADYQRQLSGGEADLAGYWRLDDPLDDGVADASGNNADGTLDGASAVRFLGRAAEFTGAADEEFSSAGAFDPGTGDLSVSAWVRLDDVATAQTIVGKGDPDGAGGWSIELDGTGKLVVSVGDGSAAIAQQVDVSGLDGWRHIGFTFDRGATDSTIQGYLDGSAGGWGAPPDGFDTIPTVALASTVTSAGRFAVGAQHDGAAYSQRFDGAVDELRIYDAARTASDMEADMISGTANPAGASGLIGYYGFEEQSGNALDASASNADLTAGSSAQRADATPGLEGTLFTVDEDQILSGLLESDAAQASPFSQGDGPDHGTLDLDAESGRWTYDPDPSYTGEDSFSFQATDASGNVTEKKITVTVEGAGGLA